jgi:radical SAM protein with 4Fe4S-binding SPASM domain
MTTSNFRALANCAVNKVETKLGRTVLQSRPPVVDVVLTKACNLACTFCRDYETEGAQRISIENFQQVVRLLLPTAKRMNICSGGEPYLHKGLEQILRYAREHNVFTWLLSNGMLMPDDRIETIVGEELVSSHGFSVDGFKDKTVEAIRVKASLPKILANIEKLIHLRKRMGKTKPTITVRYALMHMNLEELPDAVEFWGKMGIEELTCNYLAIANGIDRNESLFFHRDLTEKCFKLAREKAKQYPRLKLGLPELIEDQVRYQKEPMKCTAPWNFIMIDTNGNILPCYRAFEAIAMGNIYQRNVPDFDEIWNSPNYQALRATVNTDEDKPWFNYCGRCEMRRGWGTVEPHLGDDTWINSVNQGRQELLQIDHRRWKSKHPTTRAASAGK